MKKNKIEPIPEHFESAEEAGEFWDVHDLADYWNQTRESDLTFDLKRRHYLIKEKIGLTQRRWGHKAKKNYGHKNTQQSAKGFI
jgi:hypothetical protein